MEVAVLTPKTLKAKNRIREAGGTVWVVVKRRQRVLFTDVEGPWLLVRPPGNFEAYRWVHANADRDFDVRIIDQTVVPSSAPSVQ